MEFIVIACCGFLIIHTFDLVSLKKIPVLKFGVWALGCGLLAWSLVKMMYQPVIAEFPFWVHLLGWVLLVLASVLLVYSLFINLPFHKTYVKSGVSGELVKSGMYTLVRHPGVIWFSLAMVSLVLISGSSVMLLAAPLLILLDVLLVYIQDRYIFKHMFSGYGIYRQETPMLLPNQKSFLAFWSQIKGRRY